MNLVLITNWFKQLDLLEIWTNMITLIITLKLILRLYYYSKLSLLTLCLLKQFNLIGLQKSINFGW